MSNNRPVSSPSVTNNHSSSASKIPIWLDCDPGHDDACAIILAGFSSKCRLLGLSTVAGNVSLEKTTQNALKVLHLTGLVYLPVVPGSAKPLLRPSRVCPEIHGQSGLDSFEAINWTEVMNTDTSRKAVNSKAVNYIATAIKAAVSQHKEKVTIVATACLTNIALLLTVYPEIVDDIKQIVIMGGAVGHSVSGNTKPNAEFNFEIDPEAAAIVFQSGVEITLVPLDVTHKVLVNPTVMDAIAHGGTVNSKEENPTDTSIGPVTPFRRIMVSLLQYFMKSYHDTFRMTYPPLHDPLAVFAAIDPTAFTTTRRYVTIETVSPICAGCSIVDWHGLLRKNPNANICLDVDVPLFWRNMLEALAQADAHSPINSADDIKMAKAILGNLITPGLPFPTLHLTSPLKGVPITATTILTPHVNTVTSSDVPVTPSKTTETVEVTTEESVKVNETVTTNCTETVKVEEQSSVSSSSSETVATVKDDSTSTTAETNTITSSESSMTNGGGSTTADVVDSVVANTTTTTVESTDTTKVSETTTTETSVAVVPTETSAETTAVVAPTETVTQDTATNNNETSDEPKSTETN